MKITDYLASYAAVLSTFVFVWNIAWAVRSSRSRLRIEIIPSSGVSQGGSIEGFLVSVSNPSAVRVTLFEMTVWYEQYRYGAARHWWNRYVRGKATPQGWVGAILMVDAYNPPVSLGPGEAIEFIAPINVVLRASKNNMPVRFCVRDGLMRRHFSAARKR